MPPHKLLGETVKKRKCLWGGSTGLGNIPKKNIFLLLPLPEEIVPKTFTSPSITGFTWSPALMMTYLPVSGTPGNILNNFYISQFPTLPKFVDQVCPFFEGLGYVSKSLLRSVPFFNTLRASSNSKNRSFLTSSKMIILVSSPQQLSKTIIFFSSPQQFFW